MTCASPSGFQERRAGAWERGGVERRRLSQLWRSWRCSWQRSEDLKRENAPGVYSGVWTSLVHLSQAKKRIFEMVGMLAVGVSCGGHQLTGLAAPFRIASSPETEA